MTVTSDSAATDFSNSVDEINYGRPLSLKLIPYTVLCWIDLPPEAGSFFLPDDIRTRCLPFLCEVTVISTSLSFWADPPGFPYTFYS
jgi:hypothetical protein